MSQLTFIYSSEVALQKVWKLDGNLKLDFDDPKFPMYCRTQRRSFEGVEGLFKTLTSIQTEFNPKVPHPENWAVMRGYWPDDATLAEMEKVRVFDCAAVNAAGGKPRNNIKSPYFYEEKSEGKTPKRFYRRLKSILLEQPLDWVCIDFDKVELPELGAFDVANPQPWVDAAIARELGPGFDLAHYVLDLSSSAGLKTGVSAHVWFMLEKPMDRYMWEAWVLHRTSVLGRKPKIDASMFQKERIHFTAPPKFKNDIKDPVQEAGGKRWHLIEKMEERVYFGDWASIESASVALQDEANRKEISRELNLDEEEEAKSAFNRPGVVGAFNRCFSMSETINKFLPDEFRIDTSEGRVTWLNSDSGAREGCKIVAGNTRMFNTHSGDPFEGKPCHAFDHIIEYVYDGDFGAAAEWAKSIPAVVEEMDRAELAVFDEAPSAGFDSAIEVTSEDVPPATADVFQDTPSQKPKVEKPLTPDDMMAEYPMPLKWRGAEAQYRLMDGQWWYGYIEEDDDDDGESKKKKKKYIKLWSPITVIREFISVDHGGITIEVKLQNRYGQGKIVNLARREISGQRSDVVSDLCDQGWLYVKQGDTVFLGYLRETASKRIISALDSRGWNARATSFAAPSGVILGEELKDGTILRPDLVLPSKTASAGSLDGWKAAVNKALEYDVCAHWPLAIASGFVGPLVQLLGSPSNGLAFCGETSRGKSTALALAVSAWSDPRPEAHKDGGLFVPLKSTMTSFDAMAKNANHTVLALDETALMRAQDLESLVFSVTSGVGKARTKVTGDGLRSSVSWQTFVLLTGEQSLAQRFEESTSRRMAKGAGARILDINIDVLNAEVMDTAGMRQFEEGIRANYGLAGPAFVEALIAKGYNTRSGELRHRHAGLASRISNGGSGLDGRAAGVVASVLLAAELAVEFELMEEGFDKIVDASIARFWNVIVEEKAVSGDVLSDTRLWIASRLGNAVLPTGAGARSRETLAWYDENAIYIPYTVLSSICGGSLRPSAIIKKLKEGGVAEKAANYNDKWIKGVGKIPHVKVYANDLGVTLPTSEFSES